MSRRPAPAYHSSTLNRVPWTPHGAGSPKLLFPDAGASGHRSTMYVRRPREKRQIKSGSAAEFVLTVLLNHGAATSIRPPSATRLPSHELRLGL